MSKPLQISSELCTWDSFDERVVEMSAVCCGANADAACPDGSPPDVCGPECAVYYHSFFSDCNALLTTVMATQIDEFSGFE